MVDELRDIISKIGYMAKDYRGVQKFWRIKRIVPPNRRMLHRLRGMEAPEGGTLYGVVRPGIDTSTFLSYSSPDSLKGAIQYHGTTASIKIKSLTTRPAMVGCQK